jgi:hypothetical protein
VARRTIAAQRSVDLDRHVADLAGAPVHADDRLSVDHDPATHPGRDGDVDRVGGAARGAVAPLGHDRNVRVALQECGEAEAGLDALGEWHVAPTGKVGRRHHHTAPCIERPRRRDADADRIGQALRLGRVPNLGCQAADALDDGVDPFLIIGVNRAAGRDHKVGAQIRSANAGAAEVDRQDRLAGCLIHQAIIVSRAGHGAARRRHRNLSDDARPGGRTRNLLRTKIRRVFLSRRSGTSWSRTPGTCPRSQACRSSS